ncbi:hypothetical protein C8J56DRAFT_897808 [Mycena floridula]|nr:hypothetical protein C8J56DRAFT_897808 [Mycena floridula]
MSVMTHEQHNFVKPNNLSAFHVVNGMTASKGPLLIFVQPIVNKARSDFLASLRPWVQDNQRRSTDIRHRNYGENKLVEQDTVMAWSLVYGSTCFMNLLSPASLRIIVTTLLDPSSVLLTERPKANQRIEDETLLATRARDRMRRTATGIVDCSQVGAGMPFFRSNERRLALHVNSITLHLLDGLAVEITPRRIHGFTHFTDKTTPTFVLREFQARNTRGLRSKAARIIEICATPFFAAIRVDLDATPDFAVTGHFFTVTASRNFSQLLFCTFQYRDVEAVKDPRTPALASCSFAEFTDDAHGARGMQTSRERGSRANEALGFSVDEEARPTVMEERREESLPLRLQSGRHIHNRRGRGEDTLTLKETSFLAPSSCPRLISAHSKPPQGACN